MVLMMICMFIGIMFIKYIPVGLFIIIITAIPFLGTILILLKNKNSKLANDVTSKRNKLRDIKVRYKVNKFVEGNEYDQEINELKKQLEIQTKQANSSSRKIQADFDEFRRNHYNKELELLYKDLEIGFNKIVPSEAKGEGTIAEYDEYIKDKILEN